MKKLQKLHGNINGSHLMLAILAIAFVFTSSCNQPVTPSAGEGDGQAEYGVQPPEWSRNASIYEVNIRQFSQEGTFKAFESHLPRLKNLGVDILWLMPIHPIGEKNRKGTLGSYYSVQDYKAVNPEFGTLDDFKSLVETAHEMGFYILLDWVANHTAWDHAWMTEHPEWYTTDSTGNFVAPFDWTDVAELNFDDKKLRDAMIDALKFWVIETGIDGYRCDVAGEVPTAFWERARYELDQVKPVFMLAEAEMAEHHNKAFDMSYAWELHHVFNQIAKGEKNANDLEDYYGRQDTVFPASAYRMVFITNHDENSWNGTITERLGEAAEVFAVLSFTLPGMPLLYSGQESGLNKRLEFFEKDEIDWDPTSPWTPFYTVLNQVKKTNEALWNGEYGGLMKRVVTSFPEKVFAFTRGNNGNALLIVSSLSDENLNVVLLDEELPGEYIDLLTGEKVNFLVDSSIEMAPWDYRIYKKSN